jgi:chorismate mutase
MAKTKEQIIIAGPCAVENKSQLYKTFKSIYHHIDVFRAGIWKGRTSPNNYPGYGVKALPWIRDLQKKYQIPVAVEVGTTKHVELALKYDIEKIWVGARTTVNPFAIQEIAESLRNTDIDIWVKNPIISDMGLWTGAIERFERAGIKKIKTIYRGFYSEKNKKYRNEPRWDLVEIFKKYYSDIPILFDPSHLSGNTKHIEHLVQSIDREMLSGFMFEVHNNPVEALSDKHQQLDPEEFKMIINTLRKNKCLKNTT